MNVRPTGRRCSSGRHFRSFCLFLLPWGRRSGSGEPWFDPSGALQKRWPQAAAFHCPGSQHLSHVAIRDSECRFRPSPSHRNLGLPSAGGRMSRSSKLILGVCIVAIAGWLLAFIVTHIAPDAGLVVLPFLILGPPVLFCVLAAAVIRATRDLVLQAELRTLPNIVVAIAGLIGLVAAVWWWWGEYPSTIRPSRSP